MSFEFAHDGHVFRLQTTDDGEVVCEQVDPPTDPEPLDPSEEPPHA
jgi:hypothetical protein